MSGQAIKTNTITVKEFRMWLQGVEEMQSEGWTPTPQQWSKIREKIDIIQDTIISEYPKNAQGYSQAPANTYINRAAMLADDAPPVVAGPSNLGYVPAAAPVNPLLAGGGSQIKTPDIDTSDGAYRSGFA